MKVFVLGGARLAGALCLDGTECGRRTYILLLPAGTEFTGVKASNSLKELSKASEAALGRLGYEYGKGGRQGLVEYVITKPFAFSVILEDISGLSFSRTSLFLGGFLAPNPTRSSVLINIPGDDPMGYGAASAYAKEMVGGLKKMPWKGLGIVSSRTAKVLWDRWLEPGQERRMGPAAVADEGV